MQAKRPTKRELLAARDKSVPDIISYDLKILFCGINPGLYTAAVKQHFGRPGNKFWKSMFAAGLTPYLFHPSEQLKLLDLNIGITNLVNRATISQAQVSDEEFIKGGRELVKKAKKYKPRIVAFVGIEAYRIAFGKPKAVIGLQDETLGRAKIWVLPSTSGLNAHYTKERIAEILKQLKKHVA